MMKFEMLLFLGSVFVINQCCAFKTEWIEACKGSEEFKPEDYMTENPSEDMKCFHACLLKEAGVMDDEGEFDSAKMIETDMELAKTDEDRKFVNRVIPKCVEEANGANLDGDCEKAFKLTSCIGREEKSFMKKS